MKYLNQSSTRLALSLLCAMLAVTTAAQPGSIVADDSLIVPLFKSRVVQLDEPAARVSVGNPDVADILILRATQLYVLGKDLGTTNVLLWDRQDRLVGTVAVEVTHDLDSLKEKLHGILPEENAKSCLLLILRFVRFFPNELVTLAIRSPVSILSQHEAGEKSSGLGLGVPCVEIDLDWQPRSLRRGVIVRVHAARFTLPLAAAAP